MEKQHERELESRTEALKFLQPEMFAQYEGEAREELETLMDCLDGKFLPSQEHAEQIIRKWCINLLVYLIFKGGGQRPQVYACVKCPELMDLTNMERQCGESGHFTMVTGTEKRPRPQSAPRFTLPKVCLKFIQFHVLHVRPFLFQRRNNCNPRDRECLLVDTRTGQNLHSRSITRTLRSFVKPRDPELGKSLKTMDVRSSFATIKLMEFKEAVRLGKTRQTRETYMESLGAVMNTSVDMLKTVYLAIDDSDYLVAAVNVYKYVRNEEDSSDEEE